MSGGTDISEFSDFFIEFWTKTYGQPDGSFKFVCDQCNKVIVGKELGSFYDEVCAHAMSHMPDIHIDDIPLPPNPYPYGK